MIPHVFDPVTATPVAVFIEAQVRQGFSCCVQDMGEIEGIPFSRNDVQVYPLARLRSDLWASEGMARRLMRSFIRDYVDGIATDIPRAYSRIIVQLVPYVDTTSFRLVVSDPGTQHEDVINQQALFKFCVWQVWQKITDVLLAHYLTTGEIP